MSNIWEKTEDDFTVGAEDRTFASACLRFISTSIVIVFCIQIEFCLGDYFSEGLYESLDLFIQFLKH